MNLPASYPAPSTAHLRSAFGEPRRIGKSANSSTFGESLGEFEPCWDGLSHALPKRRACQNETRQFAPLWNGPALRPAFAAQVLGQAIMDRKTQSSTLAAQSYGQNISNIPAALLLDVSI